MADEALTPQTEDEPAQIVDLDNPEEAQTPETQETEIVLDEASGSQPDSQSKGPGYNRLIRRLKNAKATTGEVEGRLATVEQENQVLKLALEQAREASETSSPPNPADFDDGVADPAYVQAVQAQNEEMVTRAVKKATASIPNAPTPNIELDRKQMAHCQRADALGIKDYDTVQDEAIRVLGHDVVNQIVGSSDRSEIVVYHLGKNPGAAEDLRDLVKTDPVRAAIEIGRLEERLKVKPRASTQPLPDPDVEVSGGSPTAGQPNQLQKRVDKAREAVQAGTATMKDVLAIKKEAKEAGIPVI